MTSAQIAIMTTIILYLCLVIFTGVMIGKRSKKSAEGFYLGGRGMGPLVTAMSAEASDMSSYLLMGIPGLAYLSGVADASWTAIGLAIGTYLNFLLVARRLRRYSVELDAITIPSFISSVVLLYTFGMNLKILPTVGLNEPAAYIMPVTALAIYPTAYITRLMRSSLLDVMGQDYMRTARAKGLREKVVVYSHAWRNALLPVITVLIGWFISIFSGSLIIEQMFALNCMGQLYYQGLMNNDFELALAIQMFYVLIALVGQLITDLSYGIVDPRVRVNK